jgi:3-hydroxymyristoyl/3-hydroxydecanoyl-(acyl carrier protein) dehydratase
MTAETPAPMTPMFQSAIQRIIPHRYPFLLVDRVTEFVPGQRIAGIKTFTANGGESQGHASGAPSVTASILIEMVTQLGAILVLERPNMEGKIAVILQIPAASMLKPVHTGDVLLVEAEVMKLRESLGELRGAAYCKGERVAEGQMRFAIAKKDDLLPQ